VKRGIWLLAVLVSTAGCVAVQPRAVRIDSTVGMYQMATLTYRIDAGKLSESVNVANITGRQVSYEQKPSGPYPDRSVVRLAVQYPHPDGHPGYALAEVVVEARKPPAINAGTKKPTWRRWADEAYQVLTQNGLPGVKLADGIYEAWALDVPRSDLDGVIGQLTQTGYFHLAGNPAPGVNVSCRIDGQRMDKQWGHVPALDGLIERVRHEGQLVSYTRPLDDEQLKPADAQPVRFAASDWPPAGTVPPTGAAPGTPGSPAPNTARGDWVANQAGVPRAPQAASTNGPVSQGPYSTFATNPYPVAGQGPYPPTYPQPGQGRYPSPAGYGPSPSQPSGSRGVVSGQPTAPQPFPTMAARYPLGAAAPQSASPNPAAGTTRSYRPRYRAADGPAASTTP